MIRENKKLPQDVIGKIPEIVQAISGDPDVVALFCFGSLAEGRLTPLSDLDFRFIRDSFDSAFLEGAGYHG